ncbi:NAD(P)-dependent oxidoreductase [Bradyrhizobium manausense]|nr:NAD(P)-dependent oxidoreductase [Bradyrhizobium manausense]
MTPTIAIIAPGAMGSAIAARLTRQGVKVLTSLEGRGPRSRERAEAAGMQHADDQRLVDEAGVILSIVPPGQANALAERFASRLGRAGHAPLFVDCNAVGVSTMAGIERVFRRTGARLVDGAIIGFPPKGDDPGPALYFSGDAASDLKGLAEYGLDVRIVDGPIGAASALKLSYAGITKGLVAIATAMVLAAERAGAGAALKTELALSQPELLARFAKTLPDMYPKAYRWVEEMHAISEFIGAEFPEALMYKGAAGLYERIAADVAGDRETCKRIDAFLAS